MVERSTDMSDSERAMTILEVLLLVSGILNLLLLNKISEIKKSYKSKMSSLHIAQNELNNQRRQFTLYRKNTIEREQQTGTGS